MKNLIIVFLFTMILNACSTVITSESNVPVEDKNIQEEISTENIDDKYYSGKQDTSTDIQSGSEEDATNRIEERSEINGNTTDKTSPNPAVLALLDDAELYESTGKQEYAVAKLERGIRIEPDNPFLWNKLAQLRLQQDKWLLAISMAQKSNTLSFGNYRLQADNWHIIALARQAIGDKQGAHEAYSKSKSLHSRSAE